MNVIAPIVAEPGRPAWRQTTFYPFAAAARSSGARSLAVDIASPSVEQSRHGAPAAVDIAITHDPVSRILRVHATNRDPVRAAETRVALSRLGAPTVSEAWSMTDPDLGAGNSAERPHRIGPVVMSGATVEAGVLRLELPPASWSFLELDGATDDG